VRNGEQKPATSWSHPTIVQCNRKGYSSEEETSRWTILFYCVGTRRVQIRVGNSDSESLHILSIFAVFSFRSACSYALHRSNVHVLYYCTDGGDKFFYLIILPSALNLTRFVYKSPFWQCGEIIATSTVLSWYAVNEMRKEGYLRT